MRRSALAFAAMLAAAGTAEAGGRHHHGHGGGGGDAVAWFALGSLVTFLSVAHAHPAPAPRAHHRPRHAHGHHRHAHAPHLHRHGVHPRPHRHHRHARGVHRHGHRAHRHGHHGYRDILPTATGTTLPVTAERPRDRASSPPGTGTGPALGTFIRSTARAPITGTERRPERPPACRPPGRKVSPIVIVSRRRRRSSLMRARSVAFVTRFPKGRHAARPDCSVHRLPSQIE